MNTKEERHTPYFFTTLLYISTTYLIQKMGLPIIINLLFIGATLAITLTMLINFKWKISAHMVGIGGLVGASLSIYYNLDFGINFYLITCILVAGLVGFARLKMNAHSVAQVYAGFVLGVLSQVGLWFFM